ncbi:MAG: hypothetical protein IPM92_02410 [Saprospiraceae bacterium]|nr:hypothetical protein [Saprospiraceae bacterium]
MEYLFKKVRIIDPGGKHHHKTRDVLVKDGMIQDIKSEIAKTKNTLELFKPDSYLSKAWIDFGCLSGEPGNEHRETLDSLANSAAIGGYATLFIFPNTSPCIQSKSEVNFILNRSKDLPVRLIPIGAISKNCKGEEMAEILQMHEAGALAFSDGSNSIQNSGLFIRALDYLKLIPQCLLINQSLDKAIAGHGQIHEGNISTVLGLLGIPSLAENSYIHRDISLLDYTQSRLLIHKVSSSESVQIIKNAKKQNSDLFSSVSIYNLIFDAEALLDFNVQLKLSPPLRNKEDRKALIKGLKEGAIDCIISDHYPWDPESKDLEFQSSAFGAISIQTCFSAYCTYLLDELGIDLWVDKTVNATASIFNLPNPSIEVGNYCDLSWFDPKAEFIMEEKSIKSISKNSPFIGHHLKGKVHGVYTKGKFYNEFAHSL